MSNIKPTYQDRSQQLYFNRCANLCHKFLECYLVRVSDNDVEAYETTDGGWLFTQTDEPVMTGPRIGHPPAPIPGRYKWMIERAELTHASRWEPEEIDFCEIEGRHDSLHDALIAAVALHQIDRAKAYDESNFWADQYTLEKEYADEIHESITIK